jgi:hypothetical protein
VNIGCIEIAILSIVVGVPVTIVALFLYGARSTVRAQAKEVSERRSRGERITHLLTSLDGNALIADDQRQLYKLMHEQPVGELPELTADGGWFERAAPVLLKLANAKSGPKVVAAYFRTFVFPSGQQAKVLEFLARLLSESGTDLARLSLFTGAATAVLVVSNPDEARWLYDRTLAAVRLHRGDPAIKTVALAIGRLSYSAGRPKRQPTVYDEQAIANDIAAQLP